MRPPYMISGESTGSFQPAPAARRSPQLLRILVMIWLLAGLGFGVWKFGTNHNKPAEPTAGQRTPAGVISSDDLLHHVETMNANITEASSRLRRSEDQISRSIPEISRNFLFVEKQHLQNALAATGAARRDLEQARQDSDLILNSIKEHETK